MEFSKFFRLPKHEKRRVSPILDSLKFHSKGPVLLQTGTDHSFLGFASKTKLDSSEGWAYKQAYVILLKLVKNKEVLARNGGGKMRRMSLFDIFLSQEKPYYHSWTRHLFIHLGWEILYLTVDQNHLTFLAGLWESTLSHLSPNHLSCRYVFKRSETKHSTAKYLSFIIPSLSQSLQQHFFNLNYDFVLWACLRRVAFYRHQHII